LLLSLLISGCEGDDGAAGAAGAAGPPGSDGISCWDLNENGTGDLPDEDINGDGVVDVFDCQAPPSAEVIPGVNNAFDSITAVAASLTASGTYDAMSDVSYDAVTETITLAAGSIPFGGLFVSITGDATLGGVTSSYTVYTFVASNNDSVAANELTSLAVGHVAEGTAADFAAAVDLVAADTLGVDSAGITAPNTEADRDPAVRASMIAISNEFENAGFVPGSSSASTVNGAIAQCMAQGGLAYDNWTKLNAGGTGVLPVAEPNGDYVRCKACHGWDALATDGGYARRSRTSSRPNAGYQDPNTVSRNISDAPVSLDMVLHAGTGRSWAEGSAIFDGTDPQWGPGTQTGNEHPDLSVSGINNGEVPSADQIRCLTAFLNYPEARADEVFAAINPDPAAVPNWCTSTQCATYTLVGSADASRGDSWYHDPSGGNCVTCHGEPEDAIGPIATGPDGGLIAFLRQDGKYSEFRHKVQWGESGNDLMSRVNMNNPSAADVADVLAYLQGKIQDAVDMESIALGGLAYDDWHNLNAGGTGLLPAAEPNKDYLRCKACHGWDALATDGGYARRSRTSGRPNAGYQDPNTVSRNISGTGVTADMILHAGTGRSWAEGSAIFDGTDPAWGAGAQKGNEHPDLSPGGVNGTEVPSDTQVTALVDFLNYPGARIDAVFSAVDPNPAAVPAWCTSTQCTDYTIVDTADATRGDDWYHDPNGGNCVTCHGEPEDAIGPIATGPDGGLLVFLRQDGKFSEFRHKVQWGESGNDLMSRVNMNNPSAADVADVLAFLRTRIDDQVAGRPVANDDTASTEQNMAVDVDVLANDTDPTNDPLSVTDFDAASTNGGTVDCTAAGTCTYTPPADFTGTDTFDYTMSDGIETATATVTVTVTTPVAVGDPAAGQAKYDAACGVCHAAGAHDTTTAAGGNDLGGRGQELVDAGLLVNDLNTTNPAMNGITLTDQEILDIAAFLDTL
jgi:mono/diheme cytochrome c family protein